MAKYQDALCLVRAKWNREELVDWVHRMREFAEASRYGPAVAVLHLAENACEFYPTTESSPIPTAEASAAGFALARLKKGTSQ